MPKPVYLGEFEQYVLLALLKIEDHPYALRLRDELNGLTRRTVSRGALYRTLDRLEQKGYVAAETEPGGAERRGQLRRLFTVTHSGRQVLRASRDTLQAIWRDVAGALQ